MTDREFHACRVAWLRDDDEAARNHLHDEILDGFVPRCDVPGAFYITNPDYYSTEVRLDFAKTTMLANSERWLRLYG